MAEKPFIQYQGDSELCQNVALALYKKIEYLYNYSQADDQPRKKKKKQPYG